MRRVNPIIGAMARFVVIFGLLIFPWPGWNDIYGGYFRALGQAAFGSQDEQRIVRFEPHHLQHGSESLNTQLTVQNRALLDSGGNGPTTETPLDTRSIGWLPTALTLALILATPVPWRQRGWAVVWGMLLVQVFILFSLQIEIWYWWYEPPTISSVHLSPFCLSILDNLRYTLITQIGASFSVPILIWILVTIRREDLFNFVSSQNGNKATDRVKSKRT